MNYKKTLFPFFLSVLFLVVSIPKTALASDYPDLIILTSYKETLKIGESYQLYAFSSHLKKVTFTSSKPSVAKVNTFGQITGKKAGTAVITAKTRSAKAFCRITVEQTIITLDKKSAAIERNGQVTLKASSSTSTPITWKSSKKSIASVDEEGVVTGHKPGETVITASADGAHVTCKIKVKQPSVRLSCTKKSLYRKETIQLTADISSGIKPVWKSSKKSVAAVDENGLVTAVKHGTATISVKADGVVKTCEITVKQPSITLNQDSLTLAAGTTAVLTANVSSGNIPAYSSSNETIVSVDDNGKITALAKGTAYIYVREDGVKARCTVHVTK